MAEELVYTCIIPAGQAPRRPIISAWGDATQESLCPAIGDATRKSNSGRNGPKLLDLAREALRTNGMDRETSSKYVSWMREFILFHDKRHPQEMGVPEIDALLGADRFRGPGGPARRGEAERALEFLYQDVLHRRWPRHKHVRSDRRRQPDRAVYLNGRQPGVKLLDRMRDALRVGKYALNTERTYVDWAKQYILFHRRSQDTDQFPQCLPPSLSLSSLRSH